MKKNKTLFLFIILLVATIFLNHRYGAVDKGFGSIHQNSEVLPFNTSLEGVSIFYDTLKKMGYDVRVEAGNFLEEPSNAVYIILDGREINTFQLEKAEDWIKDGGKLVYLTETYQEHHYPDVIDKIDNKAYLYALGEGRLFLGDIQLITNEALLTNKEGPYFLLKWLDDFDGPIHFNEYHRLAHGQIPSLYKDLPSYMKVMLFQILLFLTGYILYLGKRFGRAERIMEEILRDENEFLYGAASLYERNDCLDIVYKGYRRALERELAKGIKGIRNPEEWIDLWEKEKLPLKQQAARVFLYRKGNSSMEKKETLSIIKDMDLLIQMLAKRREENWKQLRRKNSFEE